MKAHGFCWLLSIRTLFVLVVVLIAIAPHFSFPLSSTMANNVGWLQLARGEVLGYSQQAQMEQAKNWFRRAIVADTSNQLAFQGTGMVSATFANEAAAMSSWKKGKVDPQLLIRLGDRVIERQREWNEALLYYRGAADLLAGQLNKAWFRAGNVCQRTFAYPTLLNRSNRAYCERYFAQNGGNLIINGQFDGGCIEGWDKRYFSGLLSVTYKCDRTAGRPVPAASIEGSTKEYHGGLLQQITLPQGVTISYSAWIRVQDVDLSEARLLYIGWRQDDRPRGRHLRTVSKDMEWTYLEQTFEVPKASGALFRFFPVLLTGKGIVWIDNVQLELSPAK